MSKVDKITMEKSENTIWRGQVLKELKDILKAKMNLPHNQSDWIG